MEAHLVEAVILLHELLHLLKTLGTAAHERNRLHNAVAFLEFDLIDEIT